MRHVGFNSVRPRIDQISFRKAGYMTLNLADGRIISLPLTRFPGIMQLSSPQRRRYHIADGEIVLFHADNEVYHIQDFLGTYETNAYKSPSKRLNRSSDTGIGSTVNISGKNFTVKSAK